MGLNDLLGSLNSDMDLVTQHLSLIIVYGSSFGVYVRDVGRRMNVVGLRVFVDIYNGKFFFAKNCSTSLEV